MLVVGQFETNGDDAEKNFGKGVTFPIKLGGELSEAGKKGVGRPDVGLVLVLFGSDFVAFLNIVGREFN